MPTTPPRPWRLPVLLGATIAFIALCDALLYDRPLGCGVAIVLAAATALILVRYPWVLRLGAGRLAAALALLMAGAQALDAGVLAPLLGGLALMVLAGLARSGGRREVAGLLLEGPLQALLLGTRPFLDAWLCRRWRRAHHAAPGSPAAVLRAGFIAWWLPLGCGLLFAGLFALANPVVEGWLGALWDGVRGLLDRLGVPAPVRIVVWWVAGLALWFLLRARWAKPRADADAPPVRGVDRTALALRALLVCNALFAAQNALDLSYLWGGLALPGGMTYATYAHRGAYPLMATALLAAGFVLLWFQPGSAAQDHPWARRLVLAWLAQNVLLLGAAAWRLHLYVDVYGLSLWRVAALVWFGLVGAGLLLIAWRIRARRANRWLVRANLLVASAVLAACALVDWGGMIAWHNVGLRRETGQGQPIDVTYLRSLGPAAGPALRCLALREGRTDLGERAREAASAVEYDLRADLESWPGWTLRRALWTRTP